MTKSAPRETRLASRPNGFPAAANFIAKRLTMKGFIVRDWPDRLEWIDKAVAALAGLFQGKNVGKMVKLA